ncbi:MAG TPA: 5-formyltetrahydrofolate cyclo-ligase [Gammaproteobacteria bacterium]|jgi:5-formyltetrahydrofolate cyclo-ligase|nr:5-formyltetrahydrofolate cyclo-ligase [Gammaproteobacteria bacterium]
MSNSQDLSALRRSLKSARESILSEQRHRAENQAIRHIKNWDQFPQINTIACYHATQGEFPTSVLIEQLISLGKQVYLPILRTDKKNHLAFQKIIPKQKLQPNRYGILEPVSNANLQIDVKDLDLVLLPLLGFDSAGNRLGMGGGYYDRTFAFAKALKIEKKPYLLGLAFSNQQSEKIIIQPWDVPLDGTLTENGFV